MIDMLIKIFIFVVFLSHMYYLAKMFQSYRRKEEDDFYIAISSFLKKFEEENVSENKRIAQLLPYSVILFAAFCASISIMCLCLTIPYLYPTPWKIDLLMWTILLVFIFQGIKGFISYNAAILLTQKEEKNEFLEDVRKFTKTPRYIFFKHVTSVLSFIVYLNAVLVF